MQNRKPYVRPIHRTWWAETSRFSFYMVRELTIIPLILFTLNLLVGLYSMTSGKDAWESWVAFSASPVVLVVNLLALAGALYHAKTFFSMMPQVMPIKIGQKTVSKGIIVTVQWLIVLAFSAAVMLLV